jgi:hypothetical protein
MHCKYLTENFVTLFRTTEAATFILAVIKNENSFAFSGLFLPKVL